DRGDRRYRAHAGQAGGEQQPGGTVGLHKPPGERTRRRAAEPGARPPDDLSATRPETDMRLNPLCLGGALLALLVSGAWALAQPYPSRPITMVVPFAPGGPADFLGRLLAQKLGEDVGQQIVVDNRPGANTIIGAQAVAKAKPDGYTILMAIDGTLVMNPYLYSKLPYDPFKDFEPVTLIALVPSGLVANNNVPAKTLREVIELEKA